MSIRMFPTSHCILLMISFYLMFVFLEDMLIKIIYSTLSTRLWLLDFVFQEVLFGLHSTETTD